MKKASWVNIVAALIVAVATIMGSVITANKTAALTSSKTAALEVDKRFRELAVVTAGYVSSSGTVERQVGQSFTATHQVKGKYRINFRDPFPIPPIVVAISDGGQAGADARLVSVDTTGFSIEGRGYSDHGLADMAFHFVAVQPKD